MTRKHTRRKHWPLVNPITHAIDGACITSTDRLDKLRLLELTAIEALTKGQATQSDWRDLADMVNVAESLARDRVGREVLAACELAGQALEAAHASHQATGRITVSAEHVQALRDVHEYTDLQRTSVDRARYDRAIKATANRIRGRAKDVKVLM